MSRTIPRVSRDVAQSTGYVPKALMAAPLLHEDDALGVLSVLDRPDQTLFSLHEMELLDLFARQAAIAVDLLLKARQGRATARRGRPENSTSSRDSPRQSMPSRTSAAPPVFVSCARARGHARRVGVTARKQRTKAKKRPGRLYIPPGPLNCTSRKTYLLGAAPPAGPRAGPPAGPSGMQWASTSAAASCASGCSLAPPG